MSTVWRPVGPRAPRVYWVRRAVLLGVIVVIVVAVIVALTAGSSAPSPSHPTTTPSTTPSSTPATTAVAACAPSELTLVLSTDSDSYPAGESAALIGVFSSSSSTACTISADPAEEVWTITSGADKIWTTKGCPAAGQAKTLTIKPGGTKRVTTEWNGRRRDASCTVGATALPGEYVLKATLDGIKGTPAVFHVTS